MRYIIVWVVMVMVSGCTLFNSTEVTVYNGLAPDSVANKSEIPNVNVEVTYTINDADETSLKDVGKGSLTQ